MIEIKPVRAFNAESIQAPKSLIDFQWPAHFLGGPLDLEIGCGVGWHPIQYAKKNPGRNLIAIEHTRAKFDSFLGRVQHHKELTNILAIHADAIHWVTHALKPNQIDRCFLLYPNPEPKASNKRWMRSPFMHQLLKTLKSGGELTLATNEKSYIEEAKAYAINFWNLKIIEERAFTQGNAPEGTPRTHFEKKYLQNGQTCFDLRVKKP